MTTPTAATETENGFQRAIWAVALVGVVIAIIALVVVGVRPARSVGMGGFVAVANLWSILMIVRGLLGGKRGKIPWGLIAALKFSVLFGGLYLLLKSGWADLMPLLVGYGALPIGIVAAQLGAPRPVGEEG